MPPNAPAPRPVSDRSGLLQRRRLARTARTLAQGRATPREDRLPVDADAELSKGPALRWATWSASKFKLDVARGLFAVVLTIALIW